MVWVFVGAISFVLVSWHFAVRRVVQLYELEQMLKLADRLYRWDAVTYSPQADQMDRLENDVNTRIVSLSLEVLEGSSCRKQ